MLKRGRSAPFVDPSLTALESHHIWILPAHKRTLWVAAERAASADGSAVFVPELPAVRHILIDSERRQHVLLRGNGVVLQLEITGADIMSGPIVPILSARGFNRLRRTQVQIADLGRVLSPRERTSPPKRGKVRTNNLHDGIVVHDFRVAGHPYRDAALLLHGAHAVEQAWRKDELPARMRRVWLRADQFIRGGWRTYL